MLAGQRQVPEDWTSRGLAARQFRAPSDVVSLLLPPEREVPMGITTRAAVCRAPGQPWEITELELDDPKTNEVRIKFFAAGLCHSDDHIQKGDSPMRLPVVGGPARAGTVDSLRPPRPPV